MTSALHMNTRCTHTSTQRQIRHFHPEPLRGPNRPSGSQRSLSRLLSAATTTPARVHVHSGPQQDCRGISGQLSQQSVHCTRA